MGKGGEREGRDREIKERGRGIKGGRGEKPVAQRQEMVIGTLALLWNFLIVAVK